MAKKKKRVWIPIVVVLFILYIFFAAQPVQIENILQYQWITSIASEITDAGQVQGSLIPFSLNNKFGYIDEWGKLSFNKIKDGNVSLSNSRWAEYAGIPEEIEIKSPLDEELFSLSDPKGYPFFLDERNFLIGKEQNSISTIDDSGRVLWTYEFDAPITCVDAKANLLFVGLLNGTVILLNNTGNAVFSFDALGSRIAVMYACKISDDGKKLAAVSGLDEQRFLLFEQYSDSYRVTYHEYIGEGYRRPVHLSFVDSDRRVVYERAGGIGIYDIESRESSMVPLEASVYAIESSGIDDMLFVITSLPNNEKNLITISYPGTVTGRAPFKTESVFMSRSDSSLIIGGGDLLISFGLKKR